MKYGLNKINISVFAQQVRWFGGEGVEFYP
jgi:hypothetical protein